MDNSSLWIAGLFGSGGVVALITVILNYRMKMKELESKQKTDVQKIIKKDTPLEYHPVFTVLDELEFFFLHTLKLEDEGRTLLIRELGVVKVRTWRKVLKKYAQKATICFSQCTDEKRACSKSEALMQRMLIEGMSEYTLAFKEGMRDVLDNKKYDKESYETMQIYIELFNQWHDSRVVTVRMASREIPKSDMNQTCHNDYWDVFMVYMYAFVQLKYDATGAMKQLNGQLTGRKFLGRTIGEC